MTRSYSLSRQWITIIYSSITTHYPPPKNHPLCLITPLYIDITRTSNTTLDIKKIPSHLNIIAPTLKQYLEPKLASTHIPQEDLALHAASKETPSVQIRPLGDEEHIEPKSKIRTSGSSGGTSSSSGGKGYGSSTATHNPALYGDTNYYYGDDSGDASQSEWKTLGIIELTVVGVLMTAAAVIKCSKYCSEDNNEPYS